MRPRAAIAHAFRHRIGFPPDIVTAQPPAIGLQRKCDAPGDPHKVLRFDTRLRHPVWLCHRTYARCFRVAPMIAAVTGPVIALPATTRPIDDQASASGIAIAKVQPGHPFGSQHAPDCAKHLDEVLDVQRVYRFEPERTAPGIAVHAEGTAVRRPMSAPPCAHMLPSHLIAGLSAAAFFSNTRSPLVAAGRIATPHLRLGSIIPQSPIGWAS